MKKLILSLAMALVAPFAFAQTADVQVRTDDKPRTHARTQESADVKVRERENVQTREPRQELQQRETTEQKTETRREDPRFHVDLSFRNRDRGFWKEKGPHFWRTHERHDRQWYIVNFGEPNLRLISGCWYYRYGDCFWPAFGYDPFCQYPNGEAPVCID